MSSSVVRFPAPSRPVPLPRHRSPRLPADRPRERIGQILLDQGAVTADHLLRAVAMQNRLDAPLGRILVAEGWLREDDLLAALARQWRVPLADLAGARPDAALVAGLGVEFCLSEGILPLAGPGPVRRLVTARPDRFADLLPRLPQGHWRMEVAAAAAIEASLLDLAAPALSQAAETRLPAPFSCRSLRRGPLARAALLAVAAALALALAWPGALAGVLVVWTTLVIALQSALKLVAFAAAARPDPRPATAAAPPRGVLPTVSIIIALRQEPEVAARLLRRIAALNYPRALLDVVLVTEADDGDTRAALAAAGLPGFMRMLTVPPGSIRTKPRALNFALPLTRGEIVGIYDAEDAPARDQVFRVVQTFRAARPETACVQCVLDYYRPRTNWLSRCFTAEYAAWFRVVLPGLARLGLVVPLGGTSVFFRRGALLRLGGWDAHNVTEDADLGLRLARADLDTVVIDSVTEEEPNCRLLPWVRQRSRWLKGYAMTWAVHMRRPVRLWRDLGARRFLGVQVLFLGTLSQFLLAPLLWAAWVAGPGGLAGLAGLAPPVVLYILAAAIDIAVAAWAVRGPRHRHLWPWLPTLALYFPLATVAAWKGALELLRRPFFWDKTRHGLVD